MNKITRKRPTTIFCDNWIRSSFDPDFTVTPKEINRSIKNYHTYYDKSFKKKLGKAKGK